MSYAYMASPYTHRSLEVMEQRYTDACSAFAYLLSRRIWTYSPIVHCHEVAKLHDLPRSIEFWRDYNLAMLDGAHTLFLCCIDGWEDSKGMDEERNYAIRNQIPIRYLTRNDGTWTISVRKAF